MHKYRFFTLLSMLALCLTASAQRFFNLTSDEVSVDTILPSFNYTVPLSDNYADSTYSCSILYPEFIDMTELDIANYHKLSSDELPSLPQINQAFVVDRRKGALNVSFCPLTYRNGKYQILVSFMLRVDSKAKETVAAAKGNHKVQSSKLKVQSSERYADHSVLASGNWVKIRVPASGVYELTSALIKQAGFSDLSRVHIYGYGGNLQNEVLNGDELQNLDDLKEVPTCTVNGHRLFYAKGPVSWSSNNAARRTRNPYSDYGYYFITENDATPETIEQDDFLASFYPSADDYHGLYEQDGFSWYSGGRNLFDPHAIANGSSQTVVIPNRAGSKTGKVSVNVTAGMAASAQVAVNGSVVGNINITINTADKGNERAATYSVSNLQDNDTITVTALSGGPLHLDYVSVAWDAAAPAPDLTGSFSAPEYVYPITNQDHHADPQADMVIIIPTSQKLKDQAQRLADFHKQHDGLTSNIVPADELYNEFASGTPDANAYRRYMKMLYDRAGSDDSKLPKYLLLFGDGVWDNRLLTSDCSRLNADDLLLCYESENSFNEIHCYVDDGFYGYLDDGEGTNLQNSTSNKVDMLDVAVGRFPVSTEADAKVMVDKVINYVNNENAGAWENTIMFMGDDGNNNLHMRQSNEAAEQTASRHPGLQIKKVMWDAYTEETSSTGNRYPEVTSIIKQQQQQGALIMDYVGHGRADWMSHEAVLTLADFQAFTNTNLPLWITASCDIMAFDGVEDNIGETAVTSSKGGAIAFFGTTRTVYSTYNRVINLAYLRYVLSQQNGKQMTIGEAARQTKNYLITTTSDGDRTDNKLQYTLLGDPAIALNMPQGNVVIDSINGQATTSGTNVTLDAGSIARVVGHIEDQQDFDGTVTLNVLDSRELVTCRKNVGAEVEGDAFTFYNRSKTVYAGSDSVSKGKFVVSFAVPLDLNYSSETGLINAYAVNTDHSLAANGSNESFVLGGSGDLNTDTTGPRIFCYLNDKDFTNGGDVNTTPYFVATISDISGINATGNGIGHDLELIIDGKASMTYTLNDEFAYDFGSYTSGSVSYNIPALEPGKHSLLFRAWDTKNNASTATLDFNVVKSKEPTLNSVSVSNNPASDSTTFIVAHDLGGSTVDVIIDVFDMSGRLLWTHSDPGVSSTGGTYTYDWDLTQDSGNKLQTGVYLYRVRLASDSSSMASKAKKLIVINNK